MSIRSFFRRILGGERTSEAAATNALEATRARLERIVEIAADAIISVDEDHCIILFNRGAEEIFGWDREEVIGRPLDILLPERFRHLHGAHLDRFAEGPEAARHMGQRREIAGVRKDGWEFPAEASISRLDTPSGRVFTVVLRDVTEQKKAEHTQRFLADASSVLARSLDYEATMAGLARIALPHLADWCVIDVAAESGVTRIQATHSDPELDPVVRELQRYPPEASRPHPTLTVLETGKPELIERVTDEFLRGIAADDRHLELLRRLGVGSLLVVPLVARDRTLGAFALVSSDPARPFGSDDILLAEELGRRAALAVDNARLYEAAREAVAARDEVLAVVSHDLGNPLSAIRVSARVLDRMLDAQKIDDAGDQVDAIRQAADQMERLIRDLLEIRRIESGRLRLVRRPERVTELVERAARSVRGLAEEKSVTLERAVAAGLPEMMRVDADRVHQIFSNLVGNALKFTPPGGTITIGADPAGDGIRFWVRDTGPGMPSDALPHVFDRFWQAKQHGSPGVGLGLAIARGLTEAHGGTVDVESREGHGSTFSFEIPVNGVEP
ncbi:MAG: PAS domain-containing sensor histidine kinase [Longimicrobiales bacterium]|nr:PAS domain-containing sensor histidine kinase [Longimicrobiales bacterium]